ncbi:ankyrin repeat protein, putative [Trichomonas vaginalis G3]|uniref:Ankyrin repeat protein, putative n=1 Tax=Trichomonas vaginalis (strain ATCC PRA-98 / G3) TaxID=412133 RepID=A2DXH4_TRIV3|nr:spectrin binding [Trichomonas vaginalis G3]EAY14926.1 ankyrin repeat protein, putative [Trichomonas vaginalis G3]KAI5485408.1 spectrin binding [Trichomonas vaginalis G3]|eukprot:XP_001327149.1 ankyrin repeat protein [Trichomonas vaginalis G3]
MLTLIKNVLIIKYKMPVEQLLKSIFVAINYNFRSIKLYINIINNILSNYPISEPKAIILFNSVEKYNLQFIHNTDNIFHAEFTDDPFPKEDELLYFIIYDQIGKFKEYVTEHSLEDIDIFIPDISYISPIEACAYFGSINIFTFLHLSLDQEITEECLNLSFIGGNTDIINECMKEQDLNTKCLQYITQSHNNSFLEYIFNNEISEPDNYNYPAIIDSQNLKALIYLFNQDKDSIYPYCAALPHMLDILQSENFDFSKVSLMNRTALHYAARYHNKDAIEFLISKGIDVNETDDDESTALHLAIDDIETAKILLAHNADVNVENDNFLTPLQMAIQFENIEMVELLILHGANVNVKEDDNWTPLHEAANRNNKELVELLVSHGAEVNAQDVTGATPLIMSAFKTNPVNKEIIEYLHMHGAEINKRDYKGFTAIFCAIQRACKETIEYLLLNGAEINIKNFASEYPIHLAIEYNSKEVLELLINHGANINVKRKGGQTPLHFAIQRNKIDFVELFINHGARLNFKDKNGETPLHYAIKFRSLKSIQLLLSHGAKYNIKNHYNETALDYAENSLDVEIFNLFKPYQKQKK